MESLVKEKYNLDSEKIVKEVIDYLRGFDSSFSGSSVQAVLYKNGEYDVIHISNNCYLDCEYLILMDVNIFNFYDGFGDYVAEDYQLNMENEFEAQIISEANKSVENGDYSTTLDYLEDNYKEKCDEIYKEMREVDFDFYVEDMTLDVSEEDIVKFLEN